MSLVAQLQGASDEEIVRVLQKKMLTSGNAEATEFLRSIPSERADAIRWKLVESLESIGRKKQAAGGGGGKSGSGSVSASGTSPAATPKQPTALAPPAAAAGGGGGNVSPGQQRRVVAVAAAQAGAAAAVAAAGRSKTAAGERGSGGSALSKSAGEEGEEKKERAKGAVVGGRYQLGELLGKGGFARVFKALDLQTGQQLAVKEIQKDLLSKTELPKVTTRKAVLFAERSFR